MRPSRLLEPSYQDIRTIDLEYGRQFNWEDERQVRRVAIDGADMTDQLFGTRRSLGEPITINGIRYTVVGKIRKKEQDSNYSGPDNDKVFVPFSAMMRDFPRPDVPAGIVSQIILAPHPWVVDLLPRALDERTGRIEDIDWPLEREVRRILARRHGFDPEDRDAIAMWDTSLESLMFGRMVQAMKDFAHVDQLDEKVFFDVNSALESTLVVARNEEKYVATVETGTCTSSQVYALNPMSEPNATR